MATRSNEVKESQHHDAEQDRSIMESGSVLAAPGDLMSLGNVDQALTAKMNLVNEVRFFSTDPFKRGILTSAGY
jgi:hypothetical protein